LSEFFGLVTSMPRDLARLVKDARHGRMRVDLDLKRLDSFGHRLHSAMNRATIGIMTASLVVGSSIVMTVAEGPTLFGVPLLTFFGLLGYVIAFVNSLCIILSIWRSGRRCRTQVAQGHFAVQQVGEMGRYWTEPRYGGRCRRLSRYRPVLPLLSGRPRSAQGRVSRASPGGSIEAGPAAG